MDEQQWGEAGQQARSIAALFAEIAASGSADDLIRGEAGKKPCELHRS